MMADARPAAMPSKGLRGGSSPGPTMGQSLLLTARKRPPAGLPLSCGLPSHPPFSSSTCWQSDRLQSTTLSTAVGCSHRGRGGPTVTHLLLLIIFGRLPARLLLHVKHSVMCLSPAGRACTQRLHTGKIQLMASSEAW